MNILQLMISFLVGFSPVVAGWVLSPREESPQPKTMPLTAMMKQLLTAKNQVHNSISTEAFEAVKAGADNKCGDCRSRFGKPISAAQLKAGK